jgi:DNA-binding transcriptional MerR regulator
MGARAFTKKIPYLDTEDTLEEVGITRRQLNYWRGKGLVTPELGADAKRFTEKDVRLLKFLRRLIVDQGFPVEIAKRIIENTRASRPWEDPQFDEFEYLDLQTGALYTKKLLDGVVWSEFVATAEVDGVWWRLTDLALLYFRLLRLEFPAAADYERERQKVLDEIRGLEFAARIEWTGQPGKDEVRAQVAPSLDGDEEFMGRIPYWFNAAAMRITAYDVAGEHDLTARQRQRFYSQEAHEAGAMAVREAQDGWDDVPF